MCRLKLEMLHVGKEWNDQVERVVMLSGMSGRGNSRDVYIFNCEVRRGENRRTL